MRGLRALPEMQESRAMPEMRGSQAWQGLPEMQGSRVMRGMPASRAQGVAESPLAAPFTNLALDDRPAITSFGNVFRPNPIRVLV